jgi:membrane-bound ClpP family serine protease
MSKKWEKTLSETFVSNNINLSEEEAKQKLIDSQFQIKDLLEEKEENQQLNAAKEIVKDLNAGYNSVITMEKAKIEFLLEVIEKRRGLSK